MELLTLHDAAEEIGITYDTARRWLKQGRFLQARKVKGQWMIPLDCAIWAKRQYMRWPSSDKGGRER